MVRFFKTINSKLIFSIAALTIIIFGVFSYFFLNHQNRQLIAELYRGASMFSDTVTRSTRYDMLLDNRAGIHRMIDIIGNQKGIDVVRILNKEGKIMFSTTKGEIDNFVDKNAEACYICHAAEKPLERLSTHERMRMFQGEKHRVLAMITPIYNERDCYAASCHAHSKETRVLGVLDISMSLEEVDNEFKRNRNLFVFFTFVAIICVSTILGLLFNRLVIRPVKHLVNATQKVALGDLDVELEVNTKDEVGYLAVSFNRMLQDLKRANREIQSWNIELERKVEERTKKLRMAREQLIQSEKMASLGVLASSVAHEINNPLQGILTYIKLMLKIITGEEVSAKRVEDFISYLNLMGNEIERCGDMVKNLLVFSRQSKLNIQKSNVNTIIKNSMILMENKIKLQNIEVKLNLEENIAPTLCDVKQIQQTLIAIIINAIEAMPDGGKIIIETRNLDNVKVEIFIKDTGEGISKETMKNIFDPFFTTKEGSKSTGLGLFVAYGIIQEHKGTISVSSQLGEGTVFRITLPMMDIEQ